MPVSYNLSLVALSIAIAILASYNAFDLASRISAARGRERIEWLIGGAVLMGMGVWAMHFIGMLAVRLPIRMGFDLLPTLVSMLPAIAAAGVALHALQRGLDSWRALVLTGTLMGAGIGAMHYIGMTAMRMSPPVQYDHTMFVVSVLFAVVAAITSLTIAVRQRALEATRQALLGKLGAAAVMGLAIAGMHYIAMAATKIAPGSICLSGTQGLALQPDYQPWLVALSVAIAILASYTSLDLASRTVASRGGARRLWIVGSGLALGLGIWAMHFIGMLALRIGVPMGYDTLLTLVSMVPAVGAAAFAFYIVGQGRLTPRVLAAGGLVMGAGIGAMHYIGMAAMKMEPAIVYDPTFFALSVLLAVAASVIALWVAFKFQTEESTGQAVLRKLGSALVMGGAIAGMHYAGMAAAEIAVGSVCTAYPRAIEPEWLAGLVGMGIFLVLLLAYTIAFFDARLADMRAGLIKRLSANNEALHSRANELAIAMTTEMRASTAQMRQFATVVAQSTEAIITKDLVGNVTAWNTAAMTMFGYSAEEMIGRNISLLHPSDEKLFVSTGKFTRVNADGPTYLTGHLVAKGGNRLDVSTSVSPLFDENKKLIGSISIVRDDTFRHNAEVTIQESNQKLREMSANLEMLRENERSRFAQALHDDVGQYYLALSMGVDWIKKRHAEDTATVERSSAMRQMLDQALNAIRTIINDLHPRILEDLGLPGAGEALVEDTRVHSGLNIDYRCDESLDALPKEGLIKSTVLRSHAFSIESKPIECQSS